MGTGVSMYETKEQNEVSSVLWLLSFYQEKESDMVF
jgi:hypothetical protein